ncbi:hypothetical protein ACQR10_04370 [Bradyrhizobium sp. HKCCYLRH2060]|uniref:hypothetical protein n=1 Tax=Bradyrhizobium sp. HKCCYLRH2060 TaxID=3420743 RepID=UPI003EBF8EA9
MTPQQHADNLLRIWQGQRDVPPAQRDLDRQLTAVAGAMQEPRMRRSIAAIPLIDGSLSSPPCTDGFTAAKVEIMAQDLVQSGAFGCEQRAILTLSDRGHGYRDITRLVGRARIRARQLHAAQPKGISR